MDSFGHWVMKTRQHQTSCFNKTSSKLVLAASVCNFLQVGLTKRALALEEHTVVNLSVKKKRFLQSRFDLNFVLQNRLIFTGKTGFGAGSTDALTVLRGYGTWTRCSPSPPPQAAGSLCFIWDYLWRIFKSFAKRWLYCSPEKKNQEACITIPQCHSEFMNA